MSQEKSTSRTNAPLVNIRSIGHALGLVCMDYLSLEPDGKGTNNILVITNNFTKYTVAVPTVGQKAK